MPRHVGAAVLGLAVCLGGVVVSSGQAPAIPGGQVFRSRVEVITVAATVFDADGHLAPDLPRDAFEVYDDGEQQPIVQFTHERVPVGMGVLLDISDSMYGRRMAEARVGGLAIPLRSARRRGRVLRLRVQPRAAAGVVVDAGRARWSARAWPSLRPSGGTAVYDAVLTALPLFKTRNQPRAAMVIISDGADTASDATVRDVRSALIRSDAFVYAIAMDPPERRPINTRVNPFALREITDDTGGRTEVVSDSAGLTAATQRVAEELNSQYVLGYNAPRGADGQFHSIRVRVRHGDYRVRARRGYIAEPLTQKKSP